MEPLFAANPDPRASAERYEEYIASSAPLSRARLTRLAGAACAAAW